MVFRDDPKWVARVFVGCGPSESSKLSTKSRFRGVDGLLMLFFSSIFFFIFPMSFLISSRSLLGSILSSPMDPPTLTNDGLPGEYQHVRKNNVCDPKMVLEAFWGSRGGLWGALGHPLGALKGF